MRSQFDLDLPILGNCTFNATITRRLQTIYLPAITIEDIDLGKLGLKRTDVAAKVAITNKDWFPLNFTVTEYTVAIDGKEIATDHQPEPLLIKKQATTPAVFLVTVKPGWSLGLLPKMSLDKEDTPFRMTLRCKLIDKDSSTMFNKSRMNMVI